MRTLPPKYVPGFKLEVWWGVLGPAHLPAPIVKRLNEELNAVISTPEVSDLMAKEGATSQPGTPEDFRTLIRGDLTRWTQLIKDANIQTE